MTTKARIRRKFQVTIPEEVREKYPLEEGQYVNLEPTPQGILITAVREVGPDQAWFWSPRWAAEEQKADADFRSGRFTEAGSADEAIQQLKKPGTPKRR